MKIIIFLIFFVFSLFAKAEIYKTIDENGNVIYTDMKPGNSDSEKVELKPITPIEKAPVFSAPTSKNNKTAGAPDYYSDFKIIEPLNGVTVRNKQRFTVQVFVQPRMLSGHKVRLLLDGEIIETKRGVFFTLKDVERGTHTIMAELLDARKKVIKSSSNTIYVHRTAVSSP